ncbi:hypothetical protein [Ferruginibacter sp. HRS2-29]|uniref:hypothetical protein n=1 Tax=Ferruginibacter sp. HRS2-29 TaxID=2487334 RepID=UPI0020CC9799|nr:hypothetical protein [Ferruginibacter sp. HRS2-29]MCP9750940.1 hypothetical protein [Ferruginibacter sp. HRS2-29]
MMEHDDIHKKIAASLESLDGVSRATPAPYLLTRINAKLNALEAPNFWSRAGALLSKPKIAGIGMMVFIVMNIFVINSLKKNNTPAALTQGTTNIRYDFAINVSSIYDIENQEP